MTLAMEHQRLVRACLGEDSCIAVFRGLDGSCILKVWVLDVLLVFVVAMKSFQLAVWQGVQHSFFVIGGYGVVGSIGLGWMSRCWVVNGGIAWLNSAWMGSEMLA